MSNERSRSVIILQKVKQSVSGIREGSPSVFVTFEQTQWKYDKKF